MSSRENFAVKTALRNSLEKAQGPRMLRLPSGPPALPVVGNLLDIGLGKGLGLGPQPHVRMTRLQRCQDKNFFKKKGIPNKSVYGCPVN